MNERRTSALENALRMIEAAGPIAVERATLDVLEELLRYSTDMITVADAAGRCTYASPAIAEMIGMTPDEIQGLPAVQLIHPDDLEHLIIEVTRQIEEDTGPLPIVVRQRGPDGSWRHVESRIQQLPDGHPLGAVVANTRDISGRVKTERAHHETQRVVRMVAEGTPLETVLRAITDLVERRAPGSVAVVLGVDDQNHSLVLLSAHHQLPGALAKALDGSQLQAGNGTGALALLRRAPVETADITTDRAWSRHRTIAAESGLRTCRSIPLQATRSSTVLGTLEMYWHDLTPITDEHVVLMTGMSTVGSLSAAAVTAPVAGHRAPGPLSCESSIHSGRGWRTRAY